MATITYSNPQRCAGGGHTSLTITVNGGSPQTVVFETDDIRAPLSELTQDQRERLQLLIAKVHFAGMTRQQIINAFASGGGSVTVTV